MHFSTSTSFRALGIILISGLLFTGCGSFQNASYYSDGIYNSDNVIVIRRNKKTNAPNAYSQYFDQQAKQYNWEDTGGNVALTEVDSLNQGNLKNYQTNPNWGGGNKTTQIVIQSSPLFLGNFGNWGFGGFYDPYLAYWDYNYYNPYRWNRFAWGFNRPFFGGYYPYYRPGFFYGDPFFYGGGFWNGYGYAYNRPFNRRFNRVNRQRGAEIRNNRSYSSSYRGQASNGGGRSTVSTRAAQRDNTSVSSSRNQDDNPRSSSTVNDVPNLVQRGRTAATRQNLNDTEERVSRTQNNRSNGQRSQIDRVIRNMQNNGFEIQVIDNVQQARRYSTQNRTQNVVNGGNRSSTQRNSQPASAKEYRSSRNNNNTPSSSRSSNNVRSNSSRSYSAPARVSSGGRSSGSGRSSSGRSSSSGRRQ